MRFRSLIPLLAIGLSALAPAAAHASAGDFRFSSDNYTVHENGGSAVITVTRSDAGVEAQIRYVAVGLNHPCGASSCTGVPPGNRSPADFGASKGMLDFPAGVSSETFTVPIVDHHFATIDKTVQVALFGPSPGSFGLGNPSHAVLTIIGDDPTPPRDPANPLMLPVAPTNGDPLSGARFFVDHEDAAAMAAKRYPAIGVIASQPQPGRFGTFSGPDVGFAVNRFLVRASEEEPGTVPLLSTYRIVDGHCGNYTPSPGEVAGYHNFMTRFAQGVGSHPAVLFLEMDSIIISPCFSPQGLAIHLGELHDAINVLTATCPHLVIYLDAGAADAIPADQTARLLERAGIAQIQGFFLNSTHYDWTSREVQYGEQIARLTGKHFVVNTAVNGRGPLVPADRVHHGNEVLCNPAGRGLGPRPTTTTGFPSADAFAWIGNPGESGGACVPGAPPTGVYWPAYALMLVRNANFNVDNHAATSARASRAHHKARHRKTKHRRVRHHKTRRHAKRRHVRHTRRHHGHPVSRRIYAHMA